MEKLLPELKTCSIALPEYPAVPPAFCLGIWPLLWGGCGDILSCRLRQGRDASTSLHHKVFCGGMKKSFTLSEVEGLFFDFSINKALPANDLLLWR